MAFLTFYITYPSEKIATEQVAELVDRNLIACYNIFPMKSGFWWDGAVQNDDEWVAILKTRPEHEAAVEKAIEAKHPYDVPCIARFEMTANEAYEAWIYDSTI